MYGGYLIDHTFTPPTFRVTFIAKNNHSFTQKTFVSERFSYFLCPSETLLARANEFIDTLCTVSAKDMTVDIRIGEEVGFTDDPDPKIDTFKLVFIRTKTLSHN